MKEGRTQINHLATQWYQDVRAVPSESDSEDEAETSLINHTAEVNHHWMCSLVYRGSTISEEIWKLIFISSITYPKQSIHISKLCHADPLRDRMYRYMWLLWWFPFIPCIQCTVLQIHCTMTNQNMFEESKSTNPFPLRNIQCTCAHSAWYTKWWLIIRIYMYEKHISCEFVV